MTAGSDIHRDVVEIASGHYSIGSNNIPNASPVHRREMRSYWIDRMVVTFGHYEKFVAGGGYHNRSLWTDSSDVVEPQSIDQRCRELLEKSHQAAELFRDQPRDSVDIPLVGVTWMEAAAIARFAGGRLPFESEWEVAMMRSGGRASSEADRVDFPACWQRSPISDWGCVVAANVVQEWTADAFSPRYWRADSERHGSFWTPAQSYGVSLRGSSKADMHKDYRFRRAADPSEISSSRGFRRVWESRPTADQPSSHFLTLNGH